MAVGQLPTQSGRSDFDSECLLWSGNPRHQLGKLKTYFDSSKADVPISDRIWLLTRRYQSETVNRS